MPQFKPGDVVVTPDGETRRVSRVLPNGDVETVADEPMVNIGEDATFTVNDEPIASGTANVADLPSRIGNAAADVGIGAAKGAGRTAYNLGKVMHYTAPPLKMLGDAISPGAFSGEATEAFPELETANPTQDLGMAAEQLAEFFLPTKGINAAQKLISAGMTNAPRYLRMLARMGVEALPAAAVTAAQDGGLSGAGMAAGVAGAFPLVGGVLNRVAGAAQRGAVRSFGKAMHPTKERAKAIANKIAPAALRSGVKGSLAEVAETARAKADELNAALDQVWAMGGSGTVPVASLAAKLDVLKRPYLDSAGAALTPDDAKAIGYLDELIDSLTAKGPIVSWDDVRSINRSLARDVDRAGGYAQRSPGSTFGMPLDDQSRVAVKRDVSGVYRDEMAQNVPGAAAINKPLTLQLRLEELATMTSNRKTGQKNLLQTWLPRMTGATIGAGSGVASGDSGLEATFKGMLGATLAGNLLRVVDSPRWHLFNARQKQRLADALSSGAVPAIESAVGRLLAEEAGSSGRALRAVSGVVR